MLYDQYALGVQRTVVLHKGPPCCKVSILCYSECPRCIYLSATILTSSFFHDYCRTLSKIAIMGTDYRKELESEISEECIPKLIGGPYEGGMQYEPVSWDREYLCVQASLPEEEIDQAKECERQGRIEPNVTESSCPLPVPEMRRDVSIRDTERAKLRPLLLCPGMLGANASATTFASSKITLKTDRDDPSPLALTGWL